MPSALITRLRNIFHRVFDNELIRRVIRNSSYLFSVTGIAAVFSMLQGIFAARLLGVTVLGILGIIVQFTTTINKFASFRMNELVVKYVGQYTETDQPKQAAAVFKAASLLEIASALVAYGLIWLLAPLGARYLVRDISLTNLFWIYGLIVLANLIFESATGLLQIFDRFRQIALMTFAQSSVTLTLVFLAFLFERGLPEVMLAYMAGKIIGAIGLSLLALREAGRVWGTGWWRTPLGEIRSQAGELIRFAINTNISGTMSLINRDSELLWLSAFRGPLEAGFYKQALALANLVQMPVSPMPRATYPELSREVAKKNWPNLRYVLRQGSLLAFGYTLVVSIALVFLGKPLITLMYGAEFLPSYPALLILLIGFLVANTFYWNRIALLSLGRPDYPMKVNVLIVLLKFIGVFILLPRLGYLGSAILLTFSYILGNSLTVFKIRSEICQREAEMVS
jgi:O-antigen/teichoic acid export membrane protein